MEHLLGDSSSPEAALGPLLHLTSDDINVLLVWKLEIEFSGRLRFQHKGEKWKEMNSCRRLPPAGA